MKRVFFLLTIMLIGIFILPTSTFSQSTYTKLVWADEFNYTGLPDSTKWSYDKGTGCPEICGWGNNELQYYTAKRLENAQVKEGKLIIEARKEKYENEKYTSARIVTKNKGDWKYGRFEISAKLPAGIGIWPGIWMLPTYKEYGQWPHCGEIDIMENVGYWKDSIFGSIHTGYYNSMKGTQKSVGIFVEESSTRFHTYAVEWNEESISFFVDNKVYHVFKNEHSNSEAWPYDKSFHLLLNIAVGGNWGGKYGVDDNIFPQKMEVDYVRVYQ